MIFKGEEDFFAAKAWVSAGQVTEAVHLTPGFTLSVGVAANRLLAKFAAGLNKGCWQAALWCGGS